MAILRMDAIRKMNPKERTEKIKELRFELIRASVTANKASAKTKEIKRALSRLITLNNSAKEELKQK